MSPRATRGYLSFLMAGLLVQGLGSLWFRLQPELAAGAPLAIRGIFGIDFSHAWIHIGWGIAGLAVLGAVPTARAATVVALTFGLFYTAFGGLGVTTHHPLGLELDSFENVFHLTAGPLTLLIGLAGLARVRREAESAQAATPRSART